MNALTKIPPRPDGDQLELLGSLLEPLRRVIQPKVYGIDRVPDNGTLLVGNHTIYGLIDLPFMMRELRQQRGIIARGLGEHAHYTVPAWGKLLEIGGMVRGTRENVRELMRQREDILVFPGGAREVNKRKGEKYTLIWKERLGFARLAIEFGYPITPFAAVGAEEMLDIVVDENNPVYGAITQAVKKVTGVPLMPIARGVGPTLLPKPQRLYFWFGDPIDTARFGGRHEDDDAARAVRDEVKHAVEGGISFLLAEREADPHRGLGARLRRRES